MRLSTAIPAVTMAILLWLLLRADSAAEAPIPPCEPTASELAPPDEGEVEVVLPRLLYHRGFSHEQTSQLPSASWIGVEPLDVEGARGLHMRAASGGRLRIAPEGAFPIGHAQRARLTVVANAPAKIEVELWDPVADARVFRGLELAEGEQTLEIELPYVRYDRGRVAHASRATQWGLHFVDAVELELRSFQLWQDQLGADAELDVEHLVEAFPDPRRVVVYRRGPFAVLTDEPRLDPLAVLDALEHMHAHTLAMLPDMPAPESTVPLLVFRNERSYRQFWPRFTARFGLELAPLKEDDGYTWHGVATAWFSDRYGKVRPTYVHEAHHALFERSYGLAAQRSWLFEGLANLEQLAVSQQDLKGVYRHGLRRADASSSLLELADGKPIRTARYWQATLVCEWLLADEGRRAALGSALDEMAQRGSTDLRPLAGRHFGVELDKLAVDFWSWAWLRYGA
ncbi:MAG TPA: hypothetical protein VG755_41620 [Nannocystaceae bacterium]|nr:hypothetical protein [Nannocystaceae bacterium]